MEETQWSSLRFSVSSNCRPQKKFKSSWGGICAFSSILRQCQGTLQAKPPWSKAEEAGETEPPRRMFWPCSGCGPVTRTAGTALCSPLPAKTGPGLKLQNSDTQAVCCTVTQRRSGICLSRLFQGLHRHTGKLETLLTRPSSHTGSARSSFLYDAATDNSLLTRFCFVSDRVIFNPCTMNQCRRFRGALCTVAGLELLSQPSIC